MSVKSPTNTLIRKMQAVIVVGGITALRFRGLATFHDIWMPLEAALVIAGTIVWVAAALIELQPIQSVD